MNLLYFFITNVSAYILASPLFSDKLTIIGLFVHNLMINSLLFIYVYFGTLLHDDCSPRNEEAVNVVKLGKNITIVSFTNTIAYWFNLKYSIVAVSENFFIWWLKFWILCFLHELVFDFFHYWTHRLMHSNQLLYRFHKEHHLDTRSTTQTTFKQHPIDLLITNVLPLLLAQQIIPLNRDHYALFTIFKTLVEITGHCGKELKTHSYPQLLFLPEMFNIQLYVNDHDWHHRQPSVNFAKRFNLWDKFFATFKY